MTLQASVPDLQMLALSERTCLVDITCQGKGGLGECFEDPCECPKYGNVVLLETGVC